MNPILRLLTIGLLVTAGFIAGTAWTNSKQPEYDGNSARSATATADKTQNPSMVTAGAEPKLNASERAIIELFESAAPSVAFINTSSLSRDYWSRDITEIPRGSGSGFVWDKEGHIVTNFHVVKGADRATVTLADQSTWPAKLVGYEASKDLAVLKIEAPANVLIPIPIGQSNNLLVGQSVLAIGNPFGLDQSLSTGIISALGREIESVSGVPIRDVIQTDAAINPGNSGGPLLNSSGELIGVNTAIFSPSGAFAGIGFSIPVDVVKWVVPDLINFGKLMRPTLGVELASDQISNRLGVQGALVVNVIENSAAEKAGIRPTLRDQRGNISLGDIIIRIEREEINNKNDLILALEKYKPGEKVQVRVIRDGKETDVSLLLDSTR
jgi:S1-C subfamily serine protease